MDNTNNNLQWFDYLKEAIALGKIGQHKKALEMYDEVIKNNPEMEQPYLAKADSLIKLNRLQQAIEMYDKAIRIYQEITQPYILKLDKLERNNYKGHEINYILALYNKGNALISLVKKEEAIELFDKVLEIDSKHIFALNAKGHALFDLGKLQEAVQLFDEVLKIDPGNAGAIFLKKEAELKQATIEFKQQGGSGEVVEIVSIEDFFKTAKDRAAVIGGKLVTSDSLEEHIKMIRADDAPKYLFFDTETTGLPRNWNAPVGDLNNWPRIVQVAWILYDKNGNCLEERSYIVKPEGFRIPADASKIHGITTEIAEIDGIYLEDALIEFQDFVAQADFLVAHNMSFDEKIAGAEFLRKNMINSLISKKRICTKERSTNFCAIPSPNGFNDYKWPTLQELHQKLFGERFDEAHDALSDVRATAKCFWELKRRGVI